MYQRIVAREVRHVWEALNGRDRGPVLHGFARQFVYENVGTDHALGGTFRTVEEVSAHFDVLFRLLPDVDFAVRDVLVRGWPGSTAVLVRVAITASLPDGAAYVNELVQHLRLRWGKVTEVRAMVDNVRARAALDRLPAAAAAAAA